MATQPRPDEHQVEIRRYRPADAARTLEIFTAAVQQTASRDYTPEQVTAWAMNASDEGTWARRRLSARTYVACMAGHAVGFSDVTAEGLVDMLFVHPEAAGRGAARALLERVVRDAASAGHVRLHTHASITARPVFERLGFVIDSARENHLRGQVLRNFDMHIDLAQREGRRP